MKEEWREFRMETQWHNIGDKEVCDFWLSKLDSQLSSIIKDIEKMKKGTNCDESVVIMSAVRYMLGRSSYGIGCVCDYVKLNKDRLTESNKSVIIRDINEQIEKFPDTSYKEKWLKLADLLKHN